MAVVLEIASIPMFDTKSDPTQLGIKWTQWRRSFELYVTAKGVTDMKQKRAMLLHHAGPEVQEIFFTMEEVGGDDDYEHAITTLTTYFTPKVNIPFERHVFRQARQIDNETTDQFVTRLKQLTKTCEFGSEGDNMIRDQLVESCKSHRLRHKLLRERDLTLQKAQDIARAEEAADMHARKMEKGNVQMPQEVNKVSCSGGCHSSSSNGNGTKKGTRSKYQSRSKCGYQHSTSCYRCGKPDHFARDPHCPAKNEICRKCNMKGHFAVMCKTKQKCGRHRDKNKAVNKVAQNTESDDEYIFSVNRQKKKYIKQPETVVKMNERAVHCMIDTGASVNIIDENTYQELGCPKLSRKKTNVFAYGSKQALDVRGKFIAEIEVGHKYTAAPVLVVRGDSGNILSYQTATELDLVKIQTVNQVDGHTETSSEEIFRKYPKLFDGVGKLKDYQLNLHINENVQPIVQPTRRIPFALRKKVESKLRELEEMDIIERTTGPTRWVSPIVVVPKPSGEIRLCVDMRQANSAVERERHPIPTVDEILEDMNNSTVFSKIDLKMGYHQIELNEKSREITTFTSHVGLWRYKRLMFGISSAPEMYQHVIQDVLQGCEGVNNISDDLIIHGRDEAEHRRRLEAVLKRLSERGLTLNKEKSKFYMSKLTFMGHVLSRHGIAPDDSKVEAITKAKRPENASEVRSFMGLVTYCSKFIPDLATVAEPLRRLTKHNVSFQWKREQHEAFESVKRSMANAATLAYFDRSKDAKTQVIADASPVGLGAVLIQEQNGEFRPVYYASRTLTDVERRYSQTEKEALALVWACERFHMYLYGIHFELITDHKPLETIYSARSRPSARIERWVLRLQPYNFTVKYVPGPMNIADALSRLTQVNKLPTEVKHEPCKVSKVADEYIYFVATNAVPQALTAREIERESAADSELKSVRQFLKSGDPRTCPQDYKWVKNELSVVGKMVLRQTRIVIPKSLRKRVIELAHEGHQGVVKTKSRLREKVWWPGIDVAVERAIRSCHACQVVTPQSKPEPMHRTRLPDGPWQDLALDLMGPFPNGEHIFVVTDYYSRYPEVAILKSTTTDKLIGSLETMFATHGLPMSVTTDNGPNLVSAEFEEFLHTNGIKHRSVTPLWPQANGEVERANRTLLKAIRAAQVEGRDWRRELNTHLLAYRSTNHTTTGVSPAELLFRRKIRTKLPSFESNSNMTDEGVRDRDTKLKMKGKEYSDDRRGARESTIKPGDKVLLQQKKQNKLTPAYEHVPYTVTRKHGNQVVIESRDGVQYKRNCSHVKKYVPPDITPRDDETDNDTESEYIPDSISVSSNESLVRQDDQPEAADHAKLNIGDRRQPRERREPEAADHDNPNIGDRRQPRQRRPPQYLNDFILK